MEGWTGFWSILLIVALLVFFGIAVVVTVGGFRDIRSMLRQIQKQHGDQKSRPGD